LRFKTKYERVVGRRGAWGVSAEKRGLGARTPIVGGDASTKLFRKNWIKYEITLSLEKQRGAEMKCGSLSRW